MRAERIRGISAVEVELMRSGAGSRLSGSREFSRDATAKSATTPSGRARPASVRPSPVTMSAAEASSKWAAMVWARVSTSFDATGWRYGRLSEREPIGPHREHTSRCRIHEVDLVHWDAEDFAGEHRERR